MSWVIVRISDGHAIAETYSRSVVSAINTDKYKAVPILEYLVSINGRAQQ